MRFQEFVGRKQCDESGRAASHAKRISLRKYKTIAMPGMRNPMMAA